jgi:hypothetical protein
LLYEKADTRRNETGAARRTMETGLRAPAILLRHCSDMTRRLTRGMLASARRRKIPMPIRNPRTTGHFAVRVTVYCLSRDWRYAIVPLLPGAAPAVAIEDPTTLEGKPFPKKSITVGRKSTLFT